MVCPGRAPLAALVIVGTTLAAAPAHAGSPITEIEVRGNSKTTDETVIQLADIDMGDDWTEELRARVESDLNTSGLFQEVLVAPEPAPNGTRVVIYAKDKHSWVIAPTYYDQPTNRGGGVGFGENNLFGQNKKLLLYAQLATGDSFFVGAYVDPAINGSRFRWQYDVYLKSARSFEYSAPTSYVGDTHQVRESRMHYLNTGARVGMRLFRGAAFDLRLRGARVDYKRIDLVDGVDLAEVTDDPTATAPPPPGTEGNDISTEGTLTFDTRSSVYGVSRGTRVKLSIERALPGLGSDFDYWLATASVDRGIKVFERHNLDLHARFGWGHDLPFQQEYTAGGTGLRGYKNDQFRGDLKATFNAEYSLPLFTIKGFGMRGLAFFDSAYVTFRDTDNPARNYLPGADVHGLSPLKTSVGLGTRVFLKQVVLPLLGLDVGYGLERKSLEIYLAIGLTDG